MPRASETSGDSAPKDIYILYQSCFVSSFSVSSQIYNEVIRDLLNPSSGFLDLREDSRGSIQIAGITEVSTSNAQEVKAMGPRREV